MSMMHNAHEEESERRYDPDTLRKVTALAARLQSEHQEKLSVHDMERIGAEVGLEPTFIRKALEQHNEHQANTTVSLNGEETELPSNTQVSTRGQSQTTGELLTPKSEYYAAVTAFSLPLIWGSLAYMTKSAADLTAIMTLVTPAPLAALLGFLSGRRGMGAAAAMTLVVALAPSFPFLFFNGSADMGSTFGAMFAYTFCATPMLLGLGYLGATLRERISSADTEQTAETQEAVSAQTAERKQAAEAPKVNRIHRACLSIDLVDPTALRQCAQGGLVETTFVQYRQWVEEVARSAGGALHSSVGDSMLFLFPTDASALKVARRLQEGIPSFNAALNRLPLPFQMRCGVSSGEISEEVSSTLHHLHSPMFDRAATLQHRAAPGDIVVSGEIAAAALVELETLTPLSEPVFGATAFSWRSARATQKLANPTS